ncbi:MAG: SDR family NAD(P)-dependent oxidoreductase [Quadrisphaera sp.]
MASQTQLPRITSPFTSRSTALEVARGTDLTGRVAVVTGGASGIGVETARALAHAGAEVVLAVRDTAAGQRTADDVAATAPRRELLRPRPAGGGARPGRPHLRRRLHRPVGRSTPAPARRQRRRHGHPARDHRPGLGAPARHQPPGSLRPDHGAARRAGRGRSRGGRGARRRRVLQRARSLPGGLRRPDVRAPPLRPGAGLRAVEDGERALRRGKRAAAGPTRASRPTPSCPAASGPRCSGTGRRISALRPNGSCGRRRPPAPST